MRDKDFFKEQLGDYESPLSDRVSFDKVIARTNRKATPLWLNPKMVISAGLFLVMGTAIVGYYANGDSKADGTSNINGNNAVVVEQTKSKMPENNTAENLNSVARANFEKQTAKLEENDENLIAEALPTSTKTPASVGNGGNVVKPISNSLRGNTSEENQGELLVPKVNVISTQTVKEGEFEYEKDQVEIGRTAIVNNNLQEKANNDANAVVMAPESKIEDSKIQADTKQDVVIALVNESDKSEGTTPNNTITEKPVVVATKEQPDDEKMEKGDDKEFRRGFNLEVGVLSTEAQVFGAIGEDAAIAGSQRSFAMQALLLKEVSNKVQLGAGIGYGMNQSIGKYDWTNRTTQQNITSRQQVIIQPGLPNRTITVYDTSYSQKVENKSKDLYYNSEFISLPIGLRYKIKDLGAFKILGTYTLEPGLLIVNSGHAFNTSEIVSTTNELNNSLIIQNRFSARLSYELGAKWAFLVEPVYSHTHYSEKVLNINKSSRFGMGVGLIFKL